MTVGLLVARRYFAFILYAKAVLEQVHLNNTMLLGFVIILSMCRSINVFLALITHLLLQ